MKDPPGSSQQRAQPPVLPLPQPKPHASTTEPERAAVAPVPPMPQPKPKKLKQQRQAASAVTQAASAGEPYQIALSSDEQWAMFIAPYATGLRKTLAEYLLDEQWAPRCQCVFCNKDMTVDHLKSARHRKRLLMRIDWNVPPPRWVRGPPRPPWVQDFPAARRADHPLNGPAAVLFNHICGDVCVALEDGNVETVMPGEVLPVAPQQSISPTPAGFDLTLWLWRRHIEKGATSLSNLLVGQNVKCDLCSGSQLYDGITFAQHIMSAEHFGMLRRRLEEPPYHLGELRQRFSTQTGDVEFEHSTGWFTVGGAAPARNPAPGPGAPGPGHG